VPIDKMLLQLKNLQSFFLREQEGPKPLLKSRKKVTKIVTSHYKKNKEGEEACKVSLLRIIHVVCA
jgi:hypothetical protein